jgi:outer membrane immunogenic protein
MNKLSATVALAALFAAPAMAADIPVKAPRYAAPPPVVTFWTGLYVGGHFGGGWGTKDWNQTRVDVEATGDLGNFFDPGTLIQELPTGVSVDGFHGGIQGGYRFQSGMWVFGFEGSIAGADIKGQTICFDLVCRSKIDWLATLTAQVGLALDRALLYVKGGGAWVHDKHTLEFATCLPGGVPGGTCTGSSLSTTRSGWLFGAGLAYAFDPRWSAFVEYNYMNFGKTHAALTVTEVTAGGGGSFIETRTYDIHQKLHVVKAGVNFRFDLGGGPLVARY